VSITIRPADPTKDFPRIADLLTATSLDPVSVDDLHEDEARMPPGKLRQRLVAVAASNQVIGHAWAIHYPSQSAGLFHLFVVVDPPHQQQGIGARLYNQITQFTQSHGATMLSTEILEREPAALAFAQRRGFTIARHAIAATLDLASFDERPFAGQIESLEVSGIRFCSFADVGDTPETRRKLYEINRIATVEDPAALEPTFPTFETWCRLIPDSASFQPTGQLLATDGENFVGFSGIGYDPDTRTAHTLTTGIHAAYRGRKLAQALKLLAIRFARASGATQIVTETDARNAAMIAINRKLGFQPQPGYYGLIKNLG
jgi:GNAT superfamily N-acetyltransferase